MSEPVGGLERRDWRCLGLLLGLVCCVYLLTMAGRVISGDGEAMYQTTRALLTERRLSIAPRPETAAGRGGRAYSKYGLGQSMAQAPLFLLGRLAGGAFGAPDDRPARFAVGATNAVVGTALAGVFWLTLRAWPVGRGAATAATLVFAFATLAWPYARADFSEPLQCLTLLGALYALVRWRARPHAGWAALAGAGAGMAVLTKAASVVLLAPLGMYFAVALWQRYGSRLLERERRHAAAKAAAQQLLAAGVPLAACAVFQAALNLYRFGSVTEFGYGSEPKTGFTTPVLDGIGYLLWSSGKGLFWFAPPVLVALLALPWLARRYTLEAATIGLLFLAELLYYARWWAWHGDWSWGPRYMVVTVPFVMLAWGPLLAGWWRRPAPVRALAALAVIAGTVVALLGVAVDYGAYYSVVSAQLGRGVDVREARLVPQFSPLLGHAWLVKASAYDALAGLRGNADAHGAQRDRSQNPFRRDYPWAAAFPDHYPEAPERAFGFDFWFAALPERSPFLEYWSALIACWLGASAALLARLLWQSSRAAAARGAPASSQPVCPPYETVPA